MSDNLLEFGSSGQLIATAICDFTINDHSYKAGETVLFLDDAFIRLNYSNNTSNARDSRPLLSYDECYLNSINVNFAPFNINTQNIFSTYYKNETVINEIENHVAKDKFVILFHELNTNQITIDGITNFTIIQNEGSTLLYSEDFIDDVRYTVNYQRKVECYSIDLDNKDVNIPYLKLQIKFTGNIDKSTGETYIVVDKASLQTTPVMNFQGKSVAYMNIIFRVINGPSKPRLMVIQ